MGFKTAIELSNEQIVNLFITACEGGSNYWCKKLTPYKDKGDAYESMLEGFSLIDGESGKTHRVIPKDIKEAVTLMATKYPNHFADLINENDDSVTGDVFLQLCVFKDIIYG